MIKLRVISQDINEMNPVVPFFSNTVGKKTTMMPRNYFMKCLKKICVNEIIDSIIVIINYGWQYRYYRGYLVIKMSIMIKL
jgi:hypothetical protein